MVAWDVEIKEGEQLVNDVTIAVDMKPGMADFSKQYVVNNLGDVEAKLTYTVNSFTILGRTVDLSSISDMDDYLENFYPFSITISSSRSVLPSNTSANFDIGVEWDFEDSSAFFALNNIYDFDETLSYYTKSGSTYSPFGATAANYNDNISILYLEKDDADTYFGMKCGAYQDSTGLPCLEMNLRLTVEQNA